MGQEKSRHTEERENAETTHCSESSATPKSCPMRGSAIDAAVEEDIYSNHYKSNRYVSMWN